MAEAKVSRPTKAEGSILRLLVFRRAQFQQTFVGASRIPLKERDFKDWTPFIFLDHGSGGKDFESISAT
jgi:hypothetical protein